MRREDDRGGALRVETIRPSIGDDLPAPMGRLLYSGQGSVTAPVLRTVRSDAQRSPRRSTPLPLRLQFPPCEIPRLSAAYQLDEKERAAFEAGGRIRNGAFTRANLAPILSWKVSDRGQGRQRRNSDEEVADALHTALLATTPRIAIAILTGLSGVAVPVASAILAAIRPEHYTVIDARAFRALGCGPSDIGFKASLPLDIYLPYLAFCRDLAFRCNVTLRTLEQALWQWAKTETGRTDARFSRGL